MFGSGSGRAEARTGQCGDVTALISSGPPTNHPRRAIGSLSHVPLLAYHLRGLRRSRQLELTRPTPEDLHGY